MAQRIRAVKMAFENQTPKQEAPTKITTLRHTFVDWSLLCSFHCYPKIFQYEKYVAKLIWLVLFAVFAGLTLWLVLKALTEYFAYEIVSKTEVFNERPVDFPIVTICDTNPFTTKAAESLLHHVTLVNYHKDLESMQFYDIFTAAPILTELAKMNASRADFGEEARKSLGFNKIHFSCMFNKKRCGDEAKNSQYSHTYLYDYGNCYQFNSGLNLSNVAFPFKKTTVEGQDFGLSLMVGPVSYKNKFNKYPTAFAKGLKVFVHNRTQLPTSVEGIYLEMGKETSVGVRRTFVQKYAEPYSDCVDLDITTFRPLLYTQANFSSRVVYSQKDCLNLCLQRIIIEKCECYYPKFANIGTQAPSCFNLTSYYCVYEQLLLFDATKIEGCSLECPLECESAGYDFTVSSLTFPSEQIYDLYKNDAQIFAFLQDESMVNLSTYELFRESFLAVNVFYSSTQYTKITMAPKTSLIDLISGVGGAIGIFLGFSLFSLVELVEMACLAVYVILCKLFKD